MEVVLRNENVWCSQQVERYEEYLKLCGASALFFVEGLCS